MPKHAECAGVAALSICEALLLAMKDRDVLPEHEIVGLLDDAATTLEQAGGSPAEREMLRAAARLVRAIISERNRIP